MSASVAVVGRGFGAAVHAPGWALAGAEVVAVAGREDWRDAIAGADVVSVATPPATHAEVVLEAIRRGARVLCEKPLAATLADAELLEGAAHGVATAVNFSYRAIPAFRRFRELVDADELRVLWTAPPRRRAAAPGWKDDPTQAGALAGYGVHSLDYARWLLGEATVEAATMADDEQAFTAVLAHERGRSRITVSLEAASRTHRLEAGSLVLENTHAVNTVGAFTLRDGRRRVDVPAPARSVPPGVDDRAQPFAEHARALLDDDERPTFTDGLQAQRLLEEIRRRAS